MQESMTVALVPPTTSAQSVPTLNSASLETGHQRRLYHAVNKESMPVEQSLGKKLYNVREDIPGQSAHSCSVLAPTYHTNAIVKPARRQKVLRQQNHTMSHQTFCKGVVHTPSFVPNRYAYTRAQSPRHVHSPKARSKEAMQSKTVTHPVLQVDA
jgi:hypothetical protein